MWPFYLLAKFNSKSVRSDCEQLKGWFPAVSRNFYVRKIHVRKQNRRTGWNFTCKLKSWTALNFSFTLRTFYLASILFTWLKFTCVNMRGQKRVSGNQPKTYWTKLAPRLPSSHFLCQKAWGRGWYRTRVLSTKIDYSITLISQVVYTSMFHMKIYSPHTNWRTSFTTFYKKTRIRQRPV